MTLFYGCVAFFRGGEYEKEVLTTTWHESVVEIVYQDGSFDTVKIDVYESHENINIHDGNLTYRKATKATGGVVAYKVQIASYVKTFKVLSSEMKTKSE